MTIGSLSRFVLACSLFTSFTASAVLDSGSRAMAGQYGIQRDGCQWENVYHQLHGKSGPERFLPAFCFSDPDG